jgi:hypothetical protein
MCGNVAWSFGSCVASPETLLRRLAIHIPLDYRTLQLTAIQALSTIYVMLRIRHRDCLSVQAEALRRVSMRVRGHSDVAEAIRRNSQNRTPRTPASLV